MRKLKAFLYWLATNTVFGSALYFGLVKGIDGAANIAQFYIWFSFVVSLFSLSDDVLQSMRKNAKPRVSLCTRRDRRARAGHR
jgi:heme exporter protein D